MKLYIIVSVILIIGIGSSCEKNKDAQIDEELVYYFDLFELVAEERGRVVDISSADLSGYVENIKERGILGQCKSYSDGSKEVILDESYWNSISDLEKEYIVFHELGHCLLDRSHLNVSTADGACISIMQSGEGECMASYDLENRIQLLDELFSQ